MRFAKVLRFGRTRSDVGIDLNNLLNTNYATGYSRDVHLQPEQRELGRHVGHADVDLRAALRALQLHAELLARVQAFSCP